MQIRAKKSRDLGWLDSTALVSKFSIRLEDSQRISKDLLLHSDNLV